MRRGEGGGGQSAPQHHHDRERPGPREGMPPHRQLPGGLLQRSPGGRLGNRGGGGHRARGGGRVETTAPPAAGGSALAQGGGSGRRSVKGRRPETRKACWRQPACRRSEVQPAKNQIARPVLLRSSLPEKGRRAWPRACTGRDCPPGSCRRRSMRSCRFVTVAVRG